MAETRILSLPNGTSHTVSLEPNPTGVAAVVAMLDAVNPSYRAHFIQGGFIVCINEETNHMGIEQISPQQKTADPSAPGGTDSMTDYGGVGSGGHNPENDTPE